MSNPRIPLISDQERPLVWVGAPDSGLTDDTHTGGNVCIECGGGECCGGFCGLHVLAAYPQMVVVPPRRDKLAALAAIAATVALLVVAFAVGRLTT